MTHLDLFARLLRCPALEASLPPGMVPLPPLHDDDMPADFARRLRLHSPESTPLVWLKLFNDTVEAARKTPFRFPDTEKIKEIVSPLTPLITDQLLLIEFVTRFHALGGARAYLLLL